MSKKEGSCYYYFMKLLCKMKMIGRLLFSSEKYYSSKESLIPERVLGKDYYMRV